MALTMIARSRFCSVLATFVAALVAVPLAAAPFRAPGGPHRLHRGGDNTATYPPLTTTSVDEPDAAAPRPPVLLAFPNPARGEMRLRAYAPRAATARTRVYAVTGAVVREWTHAAPPGWFEWSWNGHDARGRAMPSGLYFLEMTVGTQITRTRIVLLR